MIVEVKGDSKKIQSSISNVSGVNKVVELQADLGKDVHRLEVKGAGRGEAKEAIAKALVDIGSPPREIRSAGADLEEIFVRITAGDVQMPESPQEK